MRLQIDGEWRVLISLAAFKARFQLPSDFGITLFEPKDYTGLARLNQSGDALQHVQRETLAAVPEHLQWTALFGVLEHIQQGFEAALIAVNPVVGLRPAEVEFAVSGFIDLCQRFGYELMRLHVLHMTISHTLPHELYQTWLDMSVRVSGTKHPYRCGNADWQVQVMNTIYGRVGLVIHATDAQIYYVQDTAYSCPADAFMLRLFIQVSRNVMEALRREAAGKSS